MSASRQELAEADRDLINLTWEAPWTVNGWAASGGALGADMVRYALALLDGSAPGVGALTPQRDIVPGAQQIGYAWQTKLDKGHLVTFKTCLTGCFTSKIALDSDAHRAMIVHSPLPR